MRGSLRVVSDDSGLPLPPHRMSAPQEKELRRLTEALRLMTGLARQPEQVEALRKGAAALGLVFTKGLWKELEELNGPLTDEMRQHLREMGLDPERKQS